MSTKLRAPTTPSLMNGCMLQPVRWHRQLEISLARANMTGLSTKQVCHGVCLVYYLQVCWLVCNMCSSPYSALLTLTSLRGACKDTE